MKKQKCLPANVLQYLFRGNVVYNLRQYLQNQMKLNKTRKIKGRKDQLSTAKTHKHIPIGLALVVRYSKILTKENEYLIYRGEGCADVFAKKIEKIL